MQDIGGPARFVGGQLKRRLRHVADICIQIKLDMRTLYFDVVLLHAHRAIGNQLLAALLVNHVIGEYSLPALAQLDLAASNDLVFSLTFQTLCRNESRGLFFAFWQIHEGTIQFQQQYFAFGINHRRKSTEQGKRNEVKAQMHGAGSIN